MRKFDSELCLNNLEVYYSSNPLTTHGPSVLEMRIGEVDQEKNPGRFEDLKACGSALSHVRQVRACLKYMLTRPFPESSVDADLEVWFKGVQEVLGVNRLELRDALLIAANPDEVDWSKMDLEV